MVVGFTTTCAIGAYHHYSSEFEPHSWRGVLDKTLCDQVLSVTCDRSVVFSGFIYDLSIFKLIYRGRHGRDRMVVGFTSTCAISAYYHY
jgi:hypothetical protein